jgi:hypothetical protein
LNVNGYSGWLRVVVGPAEADVEGVGEDVSALGEDVAPDGDRVGVAGDGLDPGGQALLLGELVGGAASDGDGDVVAPPVLTLVAAVEEPQEASANSSIGNPPAAKIDRAVGPPPAVSRTRPSIAEPFLPASL